MLAFDVYFVMVKLEATDPIFRIFCNYHVQTTIFVVIGANIILFVVQVNVSYQSGMIFSIIDGRMGSYPCECVEKFVKLALNCCQEDTDARPSMAEVVRELENIWLMMPESDTRTAESFVPEPGKFVSPASSSMPTKNPYVSSDISGSDLVSGVIPTINPR